METVARAPVDTQAGPPIQHVTSRDRTWLRSGWPAFDEFDLVRPGRVLLADIGADAGQRLLARLLADAVAKRGEAVVLDGGNWSDVYRLGDEAEAMGHARLATLQGIRVARGFTAYQLQALVEDHLEEALTDITGLVVCACFPEMYLDEDLKPDEAIVLARRAMRTLRDTALARDVPVVVSNGTIAPGTKHRLRAAMEEEADVVVGLYPAPQGALRIRVPHLGTSVLAPAPGAQQRRLDDYSERMQENRGETGVFMRRAPDAQIRYLPKRAGEMKHMQKQRVKVIS
jgi:hypothetical protein